MIKVNSVVKQDKKMYVVTEVIDNNLFCLQLTKAGKPTQKMAVIDARTAVLVTPPEPEVKEDEDDDPQMVAVGDEYDDFDDPEVAQDA